METVASAVDSNEATRSNKLFQQKTAQLRVLHDEWKKTRNTDQDIKKRVNNLMRSKE